MTINYPPEDNTEEKNWTAVRRALNVAGADDVTKNRLVEIYKLDGCSRLRQEFESWTKVEREKTARAESGSAVVEKKLL
jgi:hypothetical protein